MFLSEDDLSQMDDEYLATLASQDADALYRVSCRLLSDLDKEINVGPFLCYAKKVKIGQLTWGG